MRTMVKTGLLALVVGVTTLAAGCGEEEVRAFHSYEKDIRPLMLARCVRCHGGGGTFNTDPAISVQP